MKIFDTHAHLDDIKYQSDIDLVIERCIKENVDKVVLVSASYEDSKKEKMLCSVLNEKFKDRISFFYSIGFHPDEIPFYDEKILDSNAKEIFDKFKDFLIENKNDSNMIAVGEIGLDYYNKEKTKEVIDNQKMWFILQLTIAKQHDLPVIIHSRDALNDTKDILKEYLGGNKGIMHCYSYSKEEAKYFLDMGLYLGIGGVITFKNGVKLKEVVEYAPIESLVLETDCPYLTPTPYRGERNEPSYLPYILNEIARIKNISVEYLAEVLYNNSTKVYNIK